MEEGNTGYKKLTNARDVESYAKVRGLIVAPAGGKTAHRRISTPDGSRSVVIPNHGSRKSLATGTRHFLLKFIETYGI